MKNIKGIRSGNLLELYTTGQNTEFVGGNEDFKKALGTLNRICRGTHEVISIEEDKINGIAIENYEPILINAEWLTKLTAIPHQQANIEIGKLWFKRTEIALLPCNEDFEPLSGERIISYIHQLQNFYIDKTGEKLEVPL